jgi:hypothetical protein
MGSESPRDTRKRNSRRRSKKALTEEFHHTETYPSQDLIKWIEGKYKQEQQEKWENSTTTMKERKPQHNKHKPKR